MHRSHQIRLEPNNRQRTYLARCAGVARFAYNWGLNKWKELYEAYKEDPDNNPCPNHHLINKELNAIKKTEFPWMSEVTKYAPQRAIIYLGNAFNNLYKGLGGYPNYKKRGSRDSFYIGNDVFKISEDGRSVQLPKLAKFCGGKEQHGWVKLSERPRWWDMPGTKIMGATVSRVADEWFISIRYELDVQEKTPREVDSNSKFVGIDLNVAEYVCSDGTVYQVPRAYRQSMRKLRRAQQSLSRKEKGSHNYYKQRMKVARIHARVANIRKDWLHKTTTELVRSNDVIAIEDLNVSGMTRNHHLALSISDAGFGEFRRQLEYKAQEHGVHLVKVDRWFPSSKTCSSCGSVKAKLSLSTRVYDCENCHTSIDRDYNASVNLENYARKVLPCQPVESSPSLHPPDLSSECKQPLRSRKKALTLSMDKVE